MAHPKRILVVDDNRDTVDILCQSLEQKGYTAIPAYGGAEAIQKARTDTLDCVLLDLMMPGCSGLKVCQEIRHEPITEKLPIVMLSARKDPQDISYARQMGANEYLTKPIKLSKLIEAIEAHSAHHVPQQAMMPGQTVLFLTPDTELCSKTQTVLDSERTGGSEWFRLEPVAGMTLVDEVIASAEPRAIVIDARQQLREAARLCRQLKMSAATSRIVVLVLLENAADDVKFAWANDYVFAPVDAHRLATALKRHLKKH